MMYKLQTIETKEPAFWPNGRLKLVCKGLHEAKELARISNRDMGGTSAAPKIKIISQSGEEYSIATFASVD